MDLGEEFRMKAGVSSEVPDGTQRTFKPKDTTKGLVLLLCHTKLEQH